MKEIIINVTALETRIALREDGHLAELTIEREESRSVVGNIYKGRVDAVVPGIQAAFVDIGFEKNGFLYVSDIAMTAEERDLEFVEGTVRPRGRSRRKPPAIESILKKNQNIMVQVQKDTLGTKGFRLTNYITLPGRYSVLMPTVNQTGISRKIEDPNERDRLKKIIGQVRPEGIGLITRTAAEGKSKPDLQNDAKYLARVWDKVKRKMDSVKAPSMLHEDLNPVLRMVRDTFTPEVDQLIVDDEREYSNILNFLDNLAPALKKRCKLYKARKPVFEKYGVEEEITKAMQRRVWLKSGGSIVIDPTEALVAIDVNTGRFTGRKGLEDTVFRANLEAADEIARQVRLRDLGGIIVCDFIDMTIVKHRQQLIERLQEALKKDRANTTVSEVSELGMIEMTRKRVKHNLMKALSQTCPYCEGSGMVRSVTTMTAQILRDIQSLCNRTREKRMIIQVHPDVARRLRTENKVHLDELAKEFEREFSIESVNDFHIHDLKVISARTRDPIEKGA